MNTHTHIHTLTAPTFPKLPFTPTKKLSLKLPKTPLPVKVQASTSASNPTSGTLKALLKGSSSSLYGIFMLSFSPTLAELIAYAGYDFVVIDMEHGPGGIIDALHCMRALAGNGTPVVLRVPESTSTWAKKALDLGPQGIMFPMIETAQLARDAVRFCRYPTRGVRGAAHTVVRASKYGIDEGYLGSCEEDLLVMCQVESEVGVENIEEIAAVDGVDCVQMGPLDLSASLGMLWDPGNKKVKEVLRKAEEGVIGSGKAYLSGFAMPFDSPDQLRKRGYRMVSGAVDIGLFRNAVVEDVRRFKLGSEKDEDEDNKDPDDEKYWSE